MSEEENDTGRKTKYTPETVAKIVKCLEEGSTYRVAYAMAGVGESTFYDWLKDKPEFSEAVEGAEAKAQLEREQRVRAAGVRVMPSLDKEGKPVLDENGKPVLKVVGDWRADFAWLERRRREEYAPKLVHDVTHNIGTGVTNAIQMVGAIFEGAKGGRRKTKRSP